MNKRVQWTARHRKRTAKESLSVLDRLGEKYHLICVNYDGFDGSGELFPDMITVTEKIEAYIEEKHGGRLDGAIGSSLGSSFVGQLIQRENVHLDYGIFGSPDLDRFTIGICI